MAAHIILIIAIISAIQSMFGAGVLLFGTPLLLLFGHDFVDALILLLPISIAINLMQIVQHHAHIDFSFYRKLMLLSLPPIAIFLFLVTHIRINIGLIIGPFLLLIAMKEFSVVLSSFITRLMRFETLYFITVGVVHGLSSLGGSLLTVFIHHKNYPKDVTRVTIALCYTTFASVQLMTLLLFSAQQIDIPFYDNIIYFVVGTLVFVYIDTVFYTHINPEKYKRIFALFLALSGVMLIVKSLI